MPACFHCSSSFLVIETSSRKRAMIRSKKRPGRPRPFFRSKTKLSAEQRLRLTACPLPHHKASMLFAQKEPGRSLLFYFVFFNGCGGSKGSRVPLLRPSRYAVLFTLTSEDATPPPPPSAPPRPTFHSFCFIFLL